MKILLVQCSFIGDTILSTPVISGLKTIYPDARISILTTPVAAGLVENDPLIDEVIRFDKRNRDKGLAGIVRKASELKAKGFDKVYSLHRSYRTALLLYLARIPERIGFSDASLAFLYSRTIVKAPAEHAVMRNLSLLFQDYQSDRLPCDLRLFEPPEDQLSGAARDAVAKLGDTYCVIAPGSAWKTKMWHWQGYARVAEHLIKRGMKVVLLGGGNDSEVCARIASRAGALDLSGKVSLSDTMYLMKHGSLVLCNDSMALHMASAFKKPLVTVFCATSPEFGFGPWQNPNAAVVEDETLDCKPCRRHGSMSCPNKTNACMEVSPDRVIAECDRLLG
ncbi:MAG: lipopolysaccharide heptosyltransferase II [Desulfobacteraceae bacterium]|nr:lipopolysaccharide heptosyltransferase II [Desulfobacteraceae bacterium]